MRTGHSLVRAAAAASLCALALVGCSSAGGGGASDADGGAGAADSSEQGMSDSGMEPAADPGDPEVRHVIVTASADVVVDDPAAAADQLATLATAAGGRVEAREEYAGAGSADPGTATLVLWVPSSELSAVLEDLDDVGEVQWITQSEEDVTGTVADLDARIEALQTSTDRLREIMAGAKSTEDLLDIESELSSRQADLEALQSQRDALGDQVAMSTLTVSLGAQPAAPAQARGGFVGGLESGWNALVGFVGLLLVALGALLPWLIALGVPALGIAWLWRRRRARRPRPGDGDGPGGGPGAPSGPDGPYREAASAAGNRTVTASPPA